MKKVSLRSLKELWIGMIDAVCRGKPDIVSRELVGVKFEGDEVDKIRVWK